MRFKQYIITGITITAFLFGITILDANAQAETSIKIINLTSSIIENPSASNVDKYINTMTKRGNWRYFTKDYENAADDYRSALYFLRKNKNSPKYKKLCEKLNKTLVKLDYENNNENKLEIAKNLYLEQKYFASAYEFLELLSSNYAPDVCYEYLGDISNAFKNKNAAIIYYNKTLEINPDNDCVYYKTAKIFLETNKKDEADTYFIKAIEKTTDTELLNSIAKTYEDLINIDPNNENNYEILGLTYQKLGDFNKTYLNYQIALDLKPDDIFLKYSLGNLYFEMKEYKKAVEVYTSILNKDNPYDTQIRIARAKSYGNLKNINSALKDYQIILAIYPDSKQAMYGLYSLLKTRMSFNEMINSFYPLNKNYKPTASFYNNLASILNQKNENKDAAYIYQKAIGVNPKSKEAYLELYKIYELEGNKAKSIDLAAKAYKNLPNDADIKKIYTDSNKISSVQKSSIALSYMNNRQYSKAIMIYNQIEPKDAQIYQSIANCYKYMKKYNESLINYKKALKLAPVDSDIYYSMALVYVDKNEPKNAKVYLQKAVDLDKKNLKARKLLSYLKQKDINVNLDRAYNYYKSKKYTNALTELNRVIKTLPNNPDTYYYRGLTQQGLGNYKSAVNDFQTVLKLDRTYYMAHYYLALAYDKTGKEKDALSEYEKFLGADVQDKSLIKYAQERAVKLGEKYY